MTKSEAPERVWRVKPWHPMHFEYGLASWPVPDHAGEGSTCYIREDLHQAQIAAACQRLVDQAAGMADGPDECAYIEGRMIDAIPADAASALKAREDAARAEGREAGLREVLDRISTYPAMQHGHLPTDPHAAAEQARSEIETAILALIEQQELQRLGQEWGAEEGPEA